MVMSRRPVGKDPEAGKPVIGICAVNTVELKNKPKSIGSISGT